MRQTRSQREKRKVQPNECEKNVKVVRVKKVSLSHVRGTYVTATPYCGDGVVSRTRY